MKFKTIIILQSLTAFLASCARHNPMQPIQDKIELFKSEYSQNFKHYNIDDHSMSFAWSGDEKNPPLLFIHGSPGSWEAWAEFLTDKELQKRFHIIAVDRPGYGASDPGISVSSLAEQARRIKKALEFNKSGQPAIIVGHSFGGPVAAQMAIDYPQSVKGVLFLAASVDPNLEVIHWYQDVGKWRLIGPLLPDSLRVCNEEIYDLGPQLVEQRKKFASIKSPIYIIHGERDSLVPVQNVNYMQKHIAQKQIVGVIRLKEANHFLPWNYQPQILQAIDVLDAN